MPVTLKVFISSPGDVGQERLIAGHVIERLQGEFGGSVTLEPILWEHEPLRATGHFQEQITNPAECDIVVCILWSRLGTRLPPDKFQRADGTPFASGTEWEFEEAARAYHERGRPHLLVYRKTADPSASLADEEALLERLRQKKALDAFMDRWFGNVTATFRNAFLSFSTVEQFEELLSAHLTRLIEQEIPQHHVDDAGAQVQMTWHKGSPFRGLEAFDVEHAPVFFGRRRSIGEMRDALVSQAAHGRAFLVVFGMSGCGKSSLVRAGVLPTITQPGVIEGVGLWRWCIFRPSDAAGDLFDGLAQALLEPEGLPELEEMGVGIRALAPVLREGPQGAVFIVGAGLQRAAEKVAAEERLPKLPEARLAIVIDQLEELFTLARVTPEQREKFIAALSAMARSGRVWVIATMRSDFYPLCGELPELVALKEGAGQYDLLPPTFTEIGQILREPSRAAGLRFEIDAATGERLDEQLHAAAADNPEALPLLEFTLEELFKRRTPEGVLTLAAYQQLGGMEGALAQRAEEVLAALDPEVQQALPALLHALVTVEGASGLVASRRVTVESVSSEPAPRALVEALINARLLVTDRADDGQAVVGLAHEALLRHWPRIQEWLKENHEFLITRERVQAAAERWTRESKRVDFLLPEGKPLAEAEDLLERRRADLEPELAEFIAVSKAKWVRIRRRKLQWVTSTICVLALLTFFSMFQWRRADVSWRRAERQRKRTLQTLAAITNLSAMKLADAPNAVKDRTLQMITDLDSGLLKSADQEGSSDLSTKQLRAVMLEQQGRILLRGGQLPEAQQKFAEAVRIGEDLVKHFNAPDDKRNLASYYADLADTPVSAPGVSNPFEVSRDLLQKSLKITQEFAQTSAKDRVVLVNLYLRLGDLEKGLQHPQEALDAYNAGLQLEPRLPKDDRSGQLYLAACYEAKGEVYRENHMLEKARAAFRESLRRMQVLCRGGGSPQERQLLAAVSHELADTERAPAESPSAPAGAGPAPGTPAPAAATASAPTSPAQN